MTKHFSPTYTTKKCADLTQLDCFESSHLFSANYGRWSGKDKPEKKGQRIKLGVGYYERLKTKEDMYVSFCHEDGLLIGACFFLKKRLVNGQICVWITQLVVDSSYRKKGIATRLLQSAWGFSDYFAWGLATANTLTIKTLESVTWRKVDPSIICDNLETIDRLCESLPYRTGSKTIEQGKSIIDTNFFIDRDIHETTEDIYVERLGNLPDGCEWLAFTFQTQDMYF
ncbi:MAG: GNAT family N-acetyltransferase, partial [Agathobacter sp.]